MAINLPDLFPLGLKQVNTGIAPNDIQGDPIRTSFEKHNHNMQVLNAQIAHKLEADTTYYVSTSGLDTNNGSVSAPLATIQKALDLAYQTNTAGYVIKIKLLDGTYNQNVSIAARPNGLTHHNRVTLIIEGNTVNPDAVVLNMQNSTGFCIEVRRAAAVRVTGIRFLLPNAALAITQYFVGAFNGALLQIGNVVFGSMGTNATIAAHMYAERARIEIIEGYSINGSARSHVRALDGVVEVVNTTGTAFTTPASNSPAFAAFVTALGSSTVTFASSLITYSGTVSGLTHIRDFDARVTWQNNLPNGLQNGTINGHFIGPSTATSPPAGDNTARIATTEWVRFYCDSRIDALEATLAALGSGLQGAIEGLGVCPPGSIMPYAGGSAPAGWLLANGQAVSRSTFQTLFNVIGTGYGAGNGTSTFNVPDLRGRLPIGAGQGAGLSNRGLGQVGGSEAHVLTQNEMPVHTHHFHEPAHTHALHDPGHAHAVFDPGHAHTFPGYTYDTDASEGNDGDGSAYAPVSHATFGSGTGVAIHGAHTGVFAHLALTGSWIGNTGASWAHNNMQPWLCLNFIIKT